MNRSLIVGVRRSLSIVLVGIAAFFCWGLGLMSTIEGHIWFDPYIDTWFAPGYRPELETQVHVGMTCEEVEAVIGMPLYVTPPNKFRPGLFAAPYTNDGGHDRRLGIGHRDRRHKDFAWRYYTVFYDSTDVVRDIKSGWAYD